MNHEPVKSGDRLARRLVLLGALLAASWPAAAIAELRFADVRGHLALGYAHLFADQAPAGSLSAGAGIDVPITSGLRAGLDVGYHLLGSRTLIQGSLSSGLDYSVFEALALVHWSPTAGGPLLLISAGPGLFSAHADLASSPIGATFSHQAISQTRVGAAVAITIAGPRAGPVSVGIEAGARVVPLARPSAFDPAVDKDPGTWTIAMARLAFRY